LYGVPISVIVGARWGWRRFERTRHSTLPD
jgi:hypothetical protein